MGRRSKPGNPAALRRKLLELLSDFEAQLENGNLREKVRSLVPAYHLLWDLGASLPPPEDGTSGFARMLSYLQRFQGEIIAGEELMVVSGIHDYPRRIRELRKEHGWAVLSGLMLKEMRKEEIEEMGSSNLPPTLRPEDYVLISPERDREAAHRWNVANRIRKKKNGVGAKILEFLIENVGHPVTGEELRYVANDKSEWARRVRELRTEQGWDVATNMTERPDLPMGTYILQSDHQAAPHDRKIKDKIRVQVLKRDEYKCRYVGCDFDAKAPHIPGAVRRRLELHHKQLHSKRGSNTLENLITLCNVHHDEVHEIGMEGSALDARLRPAG
jgi:hypothetical protein